MKQRLLGTDVTGATTLVTDRALKPAFGIEIPVSMVLPPWGSGAGSRARRMMLRVVPIESYVDVGCGDVFQPIAEKFHGDNP